MISRSALLATTTGLLVAIGLLGNGHLARAQAGFGTIKGRLVWGGDKLPDAPLKIKKGDPNVKDSAVCAVGDVPDEAYIIDPSTKGVAEAYAYVVAPKGTNPELEQALLSKTPDVVMDQKGCRFIPHTLAVYKGQTLIFKSSDPVIHNVRYTGFNIGGINQSVAANGSLSKTFAKSERNPVKVFCDFHPWMTSSFMVFDHPFFALTKADGSFEIKGVPAGAQRVIVRHPEFGFVTLEQSKGQPVEVPDGGAVDLGEIKLVPKKAG